MMKATFALVGRNVVVASGSVPSQHSAANVYVYSQNSWIWGKEDRRCLKFLDMTIHVSMKTEE